VRSKFFPEYLLNLKPGGSRIRTNALPDVRAGRSTPPYVL
jgi:hypothetical protein